MQDLKIRANLVLRPVFLIHIEQLALVAVCWELYQIYKY